MDQVYERQVSNHKIIKYDTARLYWPVFCPIAHDQWKDLKREFQSSEAFALSFSSFYCYLFLYRWYVCLLWFFSAFLELNILCMIVENEAISRTLTSFGSAKANPWVIFFSFRIENIYFNNTLFHGTSSCNIPPASFSCIIVPA